MKALRDPRNLLEAGLAAIRTQFRIPEDFLPDVIAAAARAAARPLTEHADWTDRDFRTLDPATSTDLDQAFAIDGDGRDIRLHYAIADVAWFVADGDPVDIEAWKRGTTTYLPGGKSGLYPAILSEAAASLLPTGARPAVILHVRVNPDGVARLDGATRAVIRSRAKLAYETATPADLPPRFGELAERIEAAADRRGAVRVDPPEQEVTRDEAGRLTLRFRPYSLVETQNAALSLAANLAVADAMLKAETGLFRVMAPPRPEAEPGLRQTARALRLNWPRSMPLAQFERRLDPSQPPQAAFMMAIRRATDGASYEALKPGELPWHAAVAATYAHATAPLRRLADRYVLQAVLAVCAGEAVPGTVTDAFSRLPAVMGKAGARDGQIDRAAIDLAETALLSGREGETFDAVVTDIGKDDVRIQLCELPVVARLGSDHLLPGSDVRVRLTLADPIQRRLKFEPVI